MKYEKYQSFSSANFQFFEVKFSIYLNRCVFVMSSRISIYRVIMKSLLTNVMRKTFLRLPVRFFSTPSPGEKGSALNWKNLFVKFQTGILYYENTPIQIYRKFQPKKKKTENFQIKKKKKKKKKKKNFDIFHISAQNINCESSVLTSTHNLCFWVTNKKKLMYTPVNPSFTI